MSFSWINHNLKVCDTKNYGKGVFAKRGIKKNELLAVFGGYIKKLSEEKKLPKEIQDEGVQINENFSLGIIKKVQFEEASFFNHSCDPNAGFKGQIFLVAMKNIKKGEQICFDYAMVLSKSKNAKFYKLRCLCGSKNCRKYITDNDWKKPELQKKYEGYFQWYLQEKINKIKKGK
jgi:SET domain-containing protein